MNCRQRPPDLVEQCSQGSSSAGCGDCCRSKRAMSWRPKAYKILNDFQLPLSSLSALLSLSCISLGLLLVLSLQSIVVFHTYVFVPSSSLPVRALIPSRFPPYSSIKDSFLSPSLRVPAAVINRDLRDEDHGLEKGTDKEMENSPIPSQSVQGADFENLGRLDFSDKVMVGKDIVGNSSNIYTIQSSNNLQENDNLGERTFAAGNDGSGRLPKVTEHRGNLSWESLSSQNEGFGNLRAGEQSGSLGGGGAQEGDKLVSEVVNQEHFVEHAEGAEANGTESLEVRMVDKAIQTTDEAIVVSQEHVAEHRATGEANGTEMVEVRMVDKAILTTNEAIVTVDEKAANEANFPEEMKIGQVETSQIHENSTEVANTSEQSRLQGTKLEVHSEPQRAQNVSGLLKPDLRFPLQNTTLEERYRWLKRNWRSFKILHSDDLSAQFAKRMSTFLRGKRALLQIQPSWKNSSILSQATPGIVIRENGVQDRFMSSLIKLNKHRPGPCKLRFFMTWISSPSSFGRRERLSIESVFKTHPSSCLVIISRSLDSPDGWLVLHRFLRKGFRVMAIAPDLPFLFQDTPAQKWFKDLKKGNVDPGEVPFGQNLSNILRLAILYRYGGIYLDSDTIVLRDFSRLSNTIGAQNINTETGNWNRLNNAVMVFDRKHPLLFKFIQEFSLTFNGSKWGHNGPYLVSRVVMRVMNRPGYAFKVLPPLAFYPVNWERIQSFFRVPKGPLEQRWVLAKMQQLKSSFAIHLWNKQSREMEVEPGSIMDLIFHKSCIFCDLEMDGASLRSS